MCSALRLETAIEGSFWRCRYGSPAGQSVPETILMFWPATCASAAEENPIRTIMKTRRRTDMAHSSGHSPKLDDQHLFELLITEAWGKDSSCNRKRLNAEKRTGVKRVYPCFIPAL